MSTNTFNNLIDLAAERLGGKALSCTDDFFAEKENLLKPGRGIFITDKYTDRGKWMDGWESRRKRVPGYDWCIIQLAATGILHGVDIDTNHFLGNHPPYASVEAVNHPPMENIDFENLHWKVILPQSPLQPGSHNFFELDDDEVYTHIRLHIYPDGGIARLKVYGEIYKDWSKVDGREILNLAEATNGAKAILCNDMFFSHMENLLMPGRGINMGDGWETKRSRKPGNRDWVIIRLAHKGEIERILVDTCHFKGNYPDTCMVEGCDIAYKDEDKLAGGEILWSTILPQSKLNADCEHFFDKEIVTREPFTHVRLSIFPDGGVSRLRLWGKVSLGS
ncbi:MAG: allantoicase [Bacteroidota bacterium]